MIMTTLTLTLAIRIHVHRHLHRGGSEFVSGQVAILEIAIAEPCVEVRGHRALHLAAELCRARHLASLNAEIYSSMQIQFAIDIVKRSYFVIAQLTEVDKHVK